MAELFSNFIWGIYEDQSREKALDTLRYRGLPTYPSNAAYNIFASFFIPKAPGGEKDIFTYIHGHQTDPMRSPGLRNPIPPWRYFDHQSKLCLTVQDGYLYKVTCYDETNPIPYVNRSIGGRTILPKGNTSRG